MKCAHCGAELKEGCLYCSACGKEAQIVPDYNVFEDDDLLNVMLEEEQHPSAITTSYKHASSYTSREEKQKIERLKKTRKLNISILVLLLIFAIFIIGIRVYVKNQQDASFEYQYQKGQEAYVNGDEEKAILYFTNAMKLDPNNLSTKEALATIYMKQQDFNSALLLYLEIIQIDKNNYDACKNLIQIYENKNEIDQIVNLSKNISNPDTLSLFKEYIVSAPDFSLDSGEYVEEISIKITSSQDYAVYYTLDGTNPKTDGILYSEEIKLSKEDTYHLRAVCVNSRNIYSEESDRTYTIEFTAPDMPVVTPDGGEFSEETLVKISVPYGCTAYYTWDGKNPGTSSDKYTEPLEVPAGNNVLSVIVVDNKTKKTSDIYRGRFVYYSTN